MNRSLLIRADRRGFWPGLLLLAAGVGMIVCARAGGAQESPEASPVVLPSHAATLARFVPPGWRLEQTKTADFNGDHRPDALLILREDGKSESPERILAVVMGEKSGYRLAESNARLIPHTDDPNQEDPLADGDVSTALRGFSLKLTLMAGAGSYETATVRYRFRFQNGCFRLVGFERMGTNRNTLDTHDLSVNFVTGAVIHRTGNAQSTNAPRETRDSLHSNPRLCLRDLGSAVDFNPQ